MKTMNVKTIKMMMVALSVLTLTACSGGGSGGGSAASTAPAIVPVTDVQKDVIASATGCTPTAITCANSKPGLRFTCAGNVSADICSGDNGTNGTNGTNGLAGTNGTNGTNGAVGATGPAGATGATGATGAQGSQGVAGTNGSGSTIAVYDGAQTRIADFTFVSADLGSSGGATRYLFYSTSADALIGYDQSGKIVSTSSLLYEFANCTGREFVNIGTVVTNQIYAFNTAFMGSQIDYKKTYGGYFSATAQSLRNPTTGGCLNQATASTAMQLISNVTLGSGIPLSPSQPFSFRAQ